MPATSGTVLKGYAAASLAGPLGPEGQAFLNQLMDAVGDGWASWANGLTVGGLTVSGSGVGAWAGSGLGGSISGGPMDLPDVTYGKGTPEQAKFVDGLRKALKQKFTKWTGSYKFTALPFSGTSTATPSSPGDFNAVPAPPTPLKTCGSGPSMAGIADVWKSYLVKPDFDLSNPQAFTDVMINAVASGIEKGFNLDWMTSTPTLNSASGVAAPGTGSGQGTSLMDGKLL